VFGLSNCSSAWVSPGRNEGLAFGVRIAARLYPRLLQGNTHYWIKTWPGVRELMMKLTKKARTKKTSLLKDKPLRNPGQSLDEELQRLWDEEVNTWVAMFLIPLILAGYE